MEKLKFAISETEDVEIPMTFSHYKYVSVIGTGAKTLIIEAIDLKTNKTVACKFNFRKFLREPVLINYLEREIRVHQSLQHPYIISILEVLYLEESIVMVFDYYNNGDLLDYITIRKFNEEGAFRIARKLIGALCYLHRRGIVHRDIKPENIVIDSRGNPILLDFGFCSETKTDALSTICGTDFYMAPEMFKCKRYDGKMADIWSLGITIFVIATGNLPFSTNNVIKMMKEMENMDEILKKSVKGKIYALLKKMLVANPAERATADELYQWIITFTELKIMKAQTNKPQRLSQRFQRMQMRTNLGSRRKIFTVPKSKATSLNHFSSKGTIII